jgi:hypothetical protein
VLDVGVLASMTPLSQLADDDATGEVAGFQEGKEQFPSALLLF